MTTTTTTVREIKYDLVKNDTDLQKVFENNNGIVILKLTAKWCGPCKNIAQITKQYYDKMPYSVVLYEIDIDDVYGEKLYMVLKRKRIVNGIPSMLCFTVGNNDIFGPDYISIGANPVEIETLFEYCKKTIKQ
jgi:thiol-disulfide isomerase/thioredoxin